MIAPVCIIRQSKHGYSLIELLVAMAIGVVSLAAVVTLLQTLVSTRSGIDSRQALFSKRVWFIQNLTNSVTWRASLLDTNNHAYLNCLVDSQQCTSSTPDHFRLLAADGTTVLYDENEKNAAGQTIGLTQTGQDCYGFDAVNGNQACPLHYAVHATVFCEDGAAGNSTDCPVSAQIRVTGTMQLSAGKSAPQALAAINTDRLSFNVFQSEPDMGSVFISYQSVYMNKGDANYQTFPLMSAAQTIKLFPGSITITQVRAMSGAQVDITNGDVVNGPGLTYHLAPQFYGMDQIQYQAQENRLGHITRYKGVLLFKIMTPYTWVGQGTPGDMTDALNWCGDVVKGFCSHNVDTTSFDNAHMVFNETCSNCDVNLGDPSKTMNIGGSLETSTRYTGTIHQVGTVSFYGVQPSNPNREPTHFSGVTIAGGSFIGYPISLGTLIPSLQITGILDYNALTLIGGKFVAPAGFMLTTGNMNIGGSIQFNANGGTFGFMDQQWDHDSVFSGDITANGSSPFDLTFNDCYFGGPDATFVLHGHMRCHDLIWDGHGSYVAHPVVQPDPSFAQNGVIDVSGNVHIIDEGGWRAWSPHLWPGGVVRISGTGDQTIIGASQGHGYLSSLTIAKPSGILTLIGTVAVQQNLVYQSGQVVTTGSTVVWPGEENGEYVFDNQSPNPLNLDNLVVGYGRYADLRRAGSPVIVNKTLTLDNCYTGASCGWGYFIGPASASIVALGDVYIRSFTYHNDPHPTATILLQGTGDQTIHGLGQAPAGLQMWTKTQDLQGGARMPTISVNKPSGKVIFDGTLDVGAAIHSPTSQSLDFSNAILSAVGYAYNPDIVLDFDGANAGVIKSFSIVSIGVDFGQTHPKIQDLNLLANQLSGDISVLGNIHVDPEFEHWSGDMSSKVSLIGTGSQTVEWPVRASGKNSAHVLEKTDVGTVNQVGVLSAGSLAIQSGVWNASGNTSNVTPVVTAPGVYNP